MRRIKSIWLIVVIFFQKLWDQAYRLIAGIPTLKHSQITPNLFLGGQYNLRGLSKLKSIGITGIINMRIHSIYTEAQYEGFHYLHLPTADNTPPTLQDLLKGAAFAHQEISNGGKIYIHCRQGLGRGPSMAIAYLLKMGATYNDALALVKKVRTFINPRPAQVQRLKELEAWLKENDATVKNVTSKPL
ncbi:dual specificity protein phosphatase family protein [Deminuibacter soli]|uniref:protein-tyrosine-phosphatase n=1 Tax=Deminuibacter soli TaxID=2291815 RepID=A0A3E1NFU0_9BACT|nr:dual specificity protein phosphatase [Deminuibacter soli]RFM26840.1 protein phosphatase [Deminuibacter soli]